MKSLVAIGLLAGVVCLLWEMGGGSSPEGSQVFKVSSIDLKQPPQPWFGLDYSLDEYIQMQPDRPIIVSFGANWCMAGLLSFNALFDPKVCAALERRGWLCLVGDATTIDALTHGELNKFGILTVPLTAIYSPKQKKWTLHNDILKKPTLLRAIQRNQF